MLIVEYLGFGFFKRGNIFIFSANKFDSFRYHYHLTDICEITKHHVMGQSSKKWFLRLGNKNLSNITKPGTKTMAPRIHSIQSLLREFKQPIVAKGKFNFNSYMEKEQINDKQQQWNSVSNAVTTANEKQDQVESDRSQQLTTSADTTHQLMKLRIQSQLLPLMIDDLSTISWKVKLDYEEIESTLISIVSESHKKKKRKFH